MAKRVSRQHKRDTKSIRPHIERLIHDVFSNDDYELSKDRVATLRVALAAVDVLHKLEDNAVLRHGPKAPEQLNLGLELSQEQVLAIRERGAKLGKA